MGAHAAPGFSAFVLAFPASVRPPVDVVPEIGQHAVPARCAHQALSTLLQFFYSVVVAAFGARLDRPVGAVTTPHFAGSRHRRAATNVASVDTVRPRDLGGRVLALDQPSQVDWLVLGRVGLQAAIENFCLEGIAVKVRTTVFDRKSKRSPVGKDLVHHGTTVRRGDQKLVGSASRFTAAGLFVCVASVGSRHSFSPSIVGSQSMVGSRSSQHDGWVVHALILDDNVSKAKDYFLNLLLSKGKRMFFTKIGSNPPA